MKLKRFFITILTIALVYFTSNAYLNRLQDKKNITNYGEEASYKNKNQKVDKEILVLLVGVDESQNKENPEPTRTDTIMLCKINYETGEINLLSIPRDSRIKVRDEFTKANHAHSYGGIELTLQTLRDFLGLDIDYYAEINYEAVVNIVNAMGGLEYDVPKGIHIDEGKYHFSPGKTKMNGEEVLYYLRTRKIYDNGDLGRVSAQQNFLKEVVNEIVKKSDSINMTEFVQTYLSYVKTNVPLKTIVDFASNMSEFSSDKFKTYTVPGIPEYIDEVSYYIPNYEKTWEIVDKVFEKYKLKGWNKEKSGYREYEYYNYPDDNYSVDENYNEKNSKKDDNPTELKENYDFDENVIDEKDDQEDNPLDNKNYFDNNINDLGEDD